MSQLLLLAPRRLTPVHTVIPVGICHTAVFLEWGALPRHRSPHEMAALWAATTDRSPARPCTDRLRQAVLAVTQINAFLLSSFFPHITGFPLLPPSSQPCRHGLTFAVPALLMPTSHSPSHPSHAPSPPLWVDSGRRALKSLLPQRCFHDNKEKQPTNNGLAEGLASFSKHVWNDFFF